MHDIKAMSARKRYAMRHATLHDAPNLIERIFPSRLDFWKVPDVETDAVITANNPVLAIILLKQALSMDLECILTADGGLDDWPYDLALHPHTTAVIASALGLSPKRYGASERFLSGLADEFISPFARRVRKMSPSVMLIQHVRQHTGEIALVTVPTNIETNRDEHAQAAWGVLGACLAESPTIKFDLERRTAVFTPRAIVTGIASGFTPAQVEGQTLIYDNCHIHAVGTAARVAITNVEKAEMMVDDIVRCTRFEF
jgi:hypothetical protein